MIEDKTRYVIRRSLLIHVIASMMLLTGSAVHAQVSIAQSIPGEYFLQGERELASAFRLNVDGSYQFFAAYGNLDEQDKGIWKVEGKTIILKSSASDINPQLSVTSSEKSTLNGTHLQFEGKDARLASLVFFTQINSVGEKPKNTDTKNTVQSSEALPPIEKIVFTLMGIFRRYEPFLYFPKDSSHNSFKVLASLGNFGWVRFNGVSMIFDGDTLTMTASSIGSARDMRFVRNTLNSK